MNELKTQIARLGIVATAESADSNPSNPAWKDANHWKITLTRPTADGRVKVKVPFSTGYGIKTTPTADDVLDCLLCEAHTVMDVDKFEDWAGDLGYEPDSRKAERIFNACKAQTEALRAFLGDNFEPLLYADNET